jgi:hypothetical protein
MVLFPIRGFNELGKTRSGGSAEIFPFFRKSKVGWGGPILQWAPMGRFFSKI